eukprot:2506951-Rhodomonas_salina.1
MFHLAWQQPFFSRNALLNTCTKPVAQCLKQEEVQLVQDCSGDPCDKQKPNEGAQNENAELRRDGALKLA